MKGYIFLSVSIVTEIIGTVCLKLSDGFTVMLPSVIVVLGYAIAFYMLGQAVKYMPLSLAYAIWSGIGTAVTVVLGILFFDDPFSMGVAIGVGLIILGIVFMNSNGTEVAEQEGKV